MGSQRVRHNLATEKQQRGVCVYVCVCVCVCVAITFQQMVVKSLVLVFLAPNRTDST